MTESLCWTYDRSGVNQTATYRGFEIRAERDDGPENPFEAWDTEPPTLVYSGRDDVSDYSNGVVDDPFAAMTDSHISRNWRLIARALGVLTDHDGEARENLKDSGGAAMGAIRRDLFSAALDDIKPSRYGGSSSDYLDALATLWRIAGCEAANWSSRGYSQGHYADGLSVATPQWATLVGAPKSSHKAQCEYAGKLWGFWAWGDCYGYVIDGDDGDSCWGYYGDDHAESGLEEAAMRAVDGIIAGRQRRRAAKAKEIVRARVPLALRPAILDAATLA